MVFKDVNIREMWVMGGWEISVLFSQLFCESKIISKQKVKTTWAGFGI